MSEMTHQWCPKCNAMLPAHLERCPRCNANLKGGGAQMWRELFQIGGVIIAVAIIPLLIVIAVGLICINSMN
ncbi:MAG: hypothetical protein HUU38_26550 [Anaerolineales bacterium]|nr:hypothetical protein [Anaerolineales bacterium]